MGLGDLRSEGRATQENLHAGAAPGDGGPRSTTLRRIPHRRRSPEESGQAGRRLLTMPGDPWQAAFLDYSNSSFAELLRRVSPGLLPGVLEVAVDEGGTPPVSNCTTLLAIRY